MSVKIIIFSVLAVGCLAQRSPYAGRRPIGYPEMQIPSTAAPSITNNNNDLGNRFGSGDTQGTTGTTTTTTGAPLPVEALGDRALVERISKLPVDHQPFWYLNWKALQDHRLKPQSFPQKGNNFIGLF